MTRYINEHPPAPKEKEQIAPFSTRLIQEMPSFFWLKNSFPKDARKAIGDWYDSIFEQHEMYYDCAGIWISALWLDELREYPWRPGISPLGAQLLLTLYEHGLFGTYTEQPKRTLRDYASANYTRAQYLALLQRINTLYEQRYHALLKSPDNIRLKRISFQMLEDVFHANGMPTGAAHLRINHLTVTRDVRNAHDHRIHTYRWVDAEGQPQHRERSFRLKHH